MARSFDADVAAIQAMEAIPLILRVVCQATGMRFSAVARVTEDRWVCLAVHDEINFGLTPGGELVVETTLCHEIRQSGRPIIIEDVARDAVYCNHRTPAQYGIQSYISVPIILKNGYFFGTLCAIDPQPAKLSDPAVLGLFTLFTQLIAEHIQASLDLLDSEGRLAATEGKLALAEERSELREKFIAVLGHDLRNPLAALSAGTRLIRRAGVSDHVNSLLDVMEKSINRMAELTGSVLDFARGRLGSGITLDRSAEPIEPALRQVVAEMKTVHPAHQIDVTMLINAPVSVDHARIAQLFSNLLSNALTYGDATAPVRVRVETTAQRFELSVANTGKPLDDEDRSRLFLAFVRGRSEKSRHGLGLGLFIAAEIAKAHGGTVDVSSDEKETRFTFSMPL